MSAITAFIEWNSARTDDIGLFICTAWTCEATGPLRLIDKLKAVLLRLKAILEGLYI
ncbi:hypothetical protein J2TS4_16750 [Paenibacillus sp. J2TS4]|nr:hypothetical protein J2TS4_16750 [Paenibacillus sp. J2TS4]